MEFNDYDNAVALVLNEKLGTFNIYIILYFLKNTSYTIKRSHCTPNH